MRLNDLKPADGAKSSRRRVGRGMGSGLGKTAGRGHKGQKSRSGGWKSVGFEGGQMPLQRRLPKRGFTSLTQGDVEQVRLDVLDRLGIGEVDLAVLKQRGLVSRSAKSAKIILAGKIERAIVLKGIQATKGATLAIQAAGGSIEG